MAEVVSGQHVVRESAPVALENSGLIWKGVSIFLNKAKFDYLFGVRGEVSYLSRDATQLFIVEEAQAMLQDLGWELRQRTTSGTFVCHLTWRGMTGMWMYEENRREKDGDDADRIDRYCRE